MNKTSILVVAFLVGFCAVHPVAMAADDKKAPDAPIAGADTKIVATPALTPPPPADAAEVADPAAVKAAEELEKAGKTDLAKKVRDIAEGMDW